MGVRLPHHLDLTNDERRLVAVEIVGLLDRCSWRLGLLLMTAFQRRRGRGACFLRLNLINALTSQFDDRKTSGISRVNVVDWDFSLLCFACLASLRYP